MTLIYHVTRAELWNQASGLVEFRPSSLATEGFIHCARREQVRGVLERYFPDRRGLLLLEIEESKVTSPIRYENTRGGQELFPHIYGPLNLSAVLGSTAVPESD